jgi:hypothetical protein
MNCSNLSHFDDSNPARLLLEHWAAKFTPDATTRTAIVERTLNLIAVDENLAQAEDIKGAMFKILHLVANEQLSQPDGSYAGKKKQAPIKIYWREPVRVCTASDVEIIYDLRHASLFLKETWPLTLGQLTIKLDAFAR